MSERVLYLHGFSGKPDGVKYQALHNARPQFNLHPPLQLPFPDRLPEGLLQKTMVVLSVWSRLRKALEVAQRAVDSFHPDVIVGSSMGGALATQLKSSAALVLIAPATRISWLPVGFGPYPDVPVPPATILIHSPNDRLVPLEASRALLRRSQPTNPGGVATVHRVGAGLTAMGFSPEDHRLLVLGATHSCNDPDPGSKGLSQDHPHVALVESTHLLSGRMGSLGRFRSAA